MRLFAPLLLTPLLALAAPLAHAQERPDRGIVELESVQSSATHRSAFGRVMDVMITALVQQQEQPRATARGAKPMARGLAMQASPPKSSAARTEPRIKVALGERFALPPSDATALAAQDTPQQ